ncbi:MAG: phosphatidylserine decarboxylase family protein [Rikenellaceae bacterium]|nr:phosphatidylserine decarboxylase family protein [Rikenellaceae bacterium]
MKINKEGYGIIAVTAAILIVLYLATAGLAMGFEPLWAAVALGVVAAALLGFVALFFREPERPVLSDPQIVFAPADGTVVACEEVEEKEYFGRRMLQVSVFMSVTNVHVNWFPVGGTVSYYKYHPGKFLVAWHPKSSEENERTTTVVRTADGTEVLFRQIAGFVARRIVSYARAGAPAVQNSHCGFIKFGSRVDLLLPLGSEVLVKLGDKTVGSQTPVARLPKTE